MIGSLNSMSFLKPHNLYDKILSIFRKTQKVNIKEQYEKYNVRAFDFHIAFIGKYKKAIFKYNNVSYKTFSVYEALNYLNKKENAYVRFVLEADYDDIRAETRFYDYCGIVETIYHGIKFFGGYRECDLKEIYHFKNDCPEDLIFYKRVEKL